MGELADWLEPRERCAGSMVFNSMADLQDAQHAVGESEIDSFLVRLTEAVGQFQDRPSGDENGGGGGGGGGGSRPGGGPSNGHGDQQDGSNRGGRPERGFGPSGQSNSNGYLNNGRGNISSHPLPNSRMGQSYENLNDHGNAAPSNIDADSTKTTRAYGRQLTHGVESADNAADAVSAQVEKLEKVQDGKRAHLAGKTDLMRPVSLGVTSTPPEAV